MSHQIFHTNIDTYVEWDALCYVLEKNPEIFIKEPKLVFKILRNFGHMIRNLAIDFSFINVKCCAEIENYLSEYCSESLQRLSLTCNISRIPFEYLQKPFQNVTAVKVLLMPGKKHHIRFINENNLPNLKRMIISDMFRYSTDEIENEAIHHENIEYLTISIENISDIPMSFRNLKHLTFSDGIYINDALCQWIRNIEHLETLKITKMEPSSLCRGSFIKLLELINIQSTLKEMYLGFHKDIHSSDILHFLEQSQILIKLYVFEIVGFYRPIGFFFSKSFSDLMQTITSNLDERWKFHIEYPYELPYRGKSHFEAYAIERIIE